MTYELTGLGNSLQHVLLELKEWAEGNMADVLANREEYDTRPLRTWASRGGTSSRSVPSGTGTRKALISVATTSGRDTTDGGDAFIDVEHLAADRAVGEDV